MLSVLEISFFLQLLSSLINEGNTKCALYNYYFIGILRWVWNFYYSALPSGDIIYLKLLCSLINGGTKKLCTIFKNITMTLKVTLISSSMLMLTPLYDKFQKKNQYTLGFVNEPQVHHFENCWPITTTKAINKHS